MQINNEITNSKMSTPVTTNECTCACNYACVQLSVYSTNTLKCEMGLSEKQINILCIIKNCHFPLTNKRISDLLTNCFGIDSSEDSVRGIIGRLKKNKIIKSESYRKGQLRGNRFIFTSLVCEHIPMLENLIKNSKPVQVDDNLNHSSLKIDRKKNLSILKNEDNDVHLARLKNLSEEDIKNTFPNLASIAFGTNQIRQIIEILAKKQISHENVLQGMIYAEWELLHKKMKGKQGEAISNPLGYVFKILSHQGSYPKPIEYLSPEEETEINQKQEEARIAKEEADKIKADEDAIKQKFEDAKHAWIYSLSDEEKQEKIAKYKAENNIKVSMPDNVILGIIYKGIELSKVAENSRASLPFVGTNGLVRATPSNPF